ncbi:MAG TPA: aldolase/citrate lyase family protein [Candidatus Dormibacteraeota bacterium]
MPEPLRRSWLLIPGSRSDLIEQSWTLEADVIIFDLEDLVHDTRKSEARAAIRNGLSQARKGGAEVFVRCDLELLYADLDAAVWPELTGIVLPKVIAVEQVSEAEAVLDRLEAERGVRRAGLVGEVNEADEPRTVENALEIHLALENAQGNHNALTLLQSSPRVRSVSLGRADLVMDLHPEPQGELHLLPHLMQRLVVVANTAGVVPIGAWWQANSRGLRATAEATLTSARLGRMAGFKGAICRDPEQVRALNEGFTPSADEVQEARALVQALAEARSQGRAYANVDGLLVDATLARAAQRIVELAEACAARDLAKSEAIGRVRVA